MSAPRESGRRQWQALPAAPGAFRKRDACIIGRPILSATTFEPHIPGTAWVIPLKGRIANLVESPPMGKAGISCQLQGGPPIGRSAGIA